MDWLPYRYQSQESGHAPNPVKSFCRCYWLYSTGDLLLRSELTDGTADLVPGATGKAGFSWENNQFIDKEPYNRLSGYMKESLKVQIADVKLDQ